MARFGRYSAGCTALVAGPVDLGFSCSAEEAWLLFRPEAPDNSNPYWTNATEAAEMLIAACIGQLDEWGVTSQAAAKPLAGLTVRRSVGINGTRLSAVLGGEMIGYIELEIFEEGERLPRHGRWADLGNLHIAQPHRRRGVATWLLDQAGDWLRLAQVERLLTYAWLEGQDETGHSYDDYRAFLGASGFLELTSTKRVWTRTPL